MIYSVSGTLALKGENFLVLEVGGVGLQIFTHRRILENLPPVGGTLKFFCHLHLREDAFELYGFSDPEELRFFRLLNSVSGVGPKSALSVLEIAELKQLAAAVKESRPDLLTRASGVGRKTAERIVLELRSKVTSDKAEAVVGIMESDADILEALTGLGYRRDQAKSALEKVGDKISDTESRLKGALKVLGGKKG
jgi:Holliday junction DNA helicase RuvA